MAVLITGASSGFGAAMCRRFTEAGFNVIGAARRSDHLEQLQRELGERFQPLTMDVADKQSVDHALNSLEAMPESFRSIDCLINNAGLALGLEAAHEADFADWETMIQTNIVGLTYLTRRVLPQMVGRGDGYIINIGSIAGTYPYAGSNVYGASKAYVRQFSLNLRSDLHGTGVRVSNVEPGLCGGTEFSHTRFKGDLDRAAAVYENTEFLSADDIADAVFWLFDRPKHMNVNSIEIMPTSQSCAGMQVFRRPQAAPAQNIQTNAKPKSLFAVVKSWFGK